MLSVRYDLLVPSSLALEVTCGALLLVGVAMRILAFKEIPSTYHIKGLVTVFMPNMKSYIPRIHLHDRRSRRALAGRARTHLGLCKRFRSLLDRQKRRKRFRADFWRALSVMQEYFPNVFASILEY